MKSFLVGGPLLGSKARGCNSCFSPLITSQLGRERYVLLPNRWFISVLAYQTGSRLGSLLTGRRDESPVEITAVALTPTSHTIIDTDAHKKNQKPQQQLLVACGDGSIRIFQLADLIPSSGSVQNCGLYWIPGACYRSNQSMNVNEGVIRHLQVDRMDSKRQTVYALVEDRSDSEKTRLFRFILSDDSVEHSCCLDENLQRHVPKKSIPHSLLVVPRDPTETSRTDFVVVVFECAILVYVFSHKDDMILLPVIIQPIQKRDLFTVVRVSPGTNDLACGHSSGVVRIFTDLFPRIESYHEARRLYKVNTALATNPRDPMKGIVIRKLHWHAHPVTSMVFEGTGDDAILYTGGDESVVVCWQLARGSTKPAEFLPRIALGGIVDMVGARDPSTLLVFCSDNSLHHFETHNQHLRWKNQGLPTVSCQLETTAKIRMLLDPLDKSSVLLSGLPAAPGLIHKFDPHEQRVASSLEVVPYNRVSRKSADDAPIPEPRIIFSSWSGDGKTLLTVDSIPSENHAVGAPEHTADGDVLGMTTTIRFWTNTQNSYRPVASMIAPHGIRNRLSSAVLSADGQYACTVSNDERAFRLWKRLKVESNDPARKVADWSCQYKVEVPAGYSNYDTGHSAVDFSSDNSVLAIAFGSMISVWDRRKVALLLSLRHMDYRDAPVEGLQFFQSGTLIDMLLSWSEQGVSLQSPFGTQGPLGKGWTWAIPRSVEKHLKVTACVFQDENNMVAVAIYDESQRKSRIYLIHAHTGTLSDKLSPWQDVEDAAVTHMTGFAKQLVDGSGMNSSKYNTFFALTNRGDLLAVTDLDRKSENGASMPALLPEESKIPKLPQHLQLHESKKRTALVLSIADFAEPSMKRLDVDDFGKFIGDETSGSSMPRLNGAFARSFVGRNLRRKEQ